MTSHAEGISFSDVFTCSQKASKFVQIYSKLYTNKCIYLWHFDLPNAFLLHSRGAVEQSDSVSSLIFEKEYVIAYP